MDRNQAYINGKCDLGRERKQKDRRIVSEKEEV
jgi:hypothetical protein